MSESCNHDCSSCGQNCADREAPQSFLAPANPGSRVKKVIGVVSGKGGVGKSLVTSMLASSMQKSGSQAAVLDADITGPSIPRMFGVNGKVLSDGVSMYPEKSEGGVKQISINLLLDNTDDPVVWRGPIIAGVVKQFWSETCWGDVDCMFVDMPPGTGDVPLTVFQSLPVDGIVVVTSPQDLVGMIVGKAVKMAEMMNIPVVGIVENMSYFECPDCGKKHFIFGDSHVEKLADQYGIDTVCRIPLKPEIAGLCDEGRIEELDAVWLAPLVDKIRS
ncbi:MAG: Mrp/NBP35 family ATP-binding protein [Firmicutes bacterium]|nr:Mrp/NBP35 family ATP-binding protein [Bacillota bacterium]MBQ2456466.1 Mrp/NBP35 family ATP-binding protein [Bacillota bacterium]MBQ3579157.1 Mrp/NBP35 family ATP-binding protein [Bacillota bacterium]MBQ5436147.1 Mrp/NBP35 family ATP-binding protein [Bacillota bacterium]MBQ6013234.1 Mrp/NBP35 family ATP-binding protein [Bacillota bacterium]